MSPVTSEGSATSISSTGSSFLRRFAAMKPSMYSIEISGPRPAGQIRVAEATRLGLVQGELQGDGAAQRMADEMRAVDAHGVHEVEHGRGRASGTVPSPTSLLEPPWPGRSSA